MPFTWRPPIVKGFPKSGAMTATCCALHRILESLAVPFNYMKIAPLILSLVSLSQAQTISGERIRAHVKFLSSDLLEGRGVAVRGEGLATEYIATQFALFGAKPAGDDVTYFQKVPLVGVQTTPESKLSAVAASGKELPFKWLDEFVG